MENKEEVLNKAIELKSISTWKYMFINTRTMQACNIQVTGIGIACVEYGGKDIDDHLELITLMDNSQLFYLKLNTVTNCGLYFITNELEELKTLSPHLGLIETAYDTIEWYPL